MIASCAKAMFSGKRFSPREFSRKTGLCLEHAAEVGDRGKVTKRTLNYGVGVLVSKETPGLDSLAELIAQCERHKEAIIETQVEEATIYCDIFHDGQCNFEFEPELLKRVSVLGAILAISCYQAKPHGQAKHVRAKQNTSGLDS